MTRGQQKIEAQKKAQAKQADQKGSQLDARAAAFKSQVRIIIIYLVFLCT